MSWFSRCSWCGGPFNGENCRCCKNVSFGDEFVHNPDPISNDETPNFFYPPSQPQTSSFDQIYCYGCRDPIEDGVRYQHFTHTSKPSRRFNSICYDDNDDDNDEESTIPFSDIISQLPPSIVITTSPPVLPTMKPDDSLIIGNEELSTIPEKESDEFIKSSVEDLVPIPSESEDTSRSDSECILPSCDDFSSINVFEEKAVTFSNILFNSNDNFTSSDDELLSDEDVPEENVKIYSNPLFEFDDEYISSDVNPLFDEVLEDIECKDSYDSNLDESTFLFTPFLILMRMSISPQGFTDEPPLEENDDLFYLESKKNDWKKILHDTPINDLMTEDKVSDPGIHDQIFSSTYVSIPFEDRHYLFFTYVV
nr:hypothetical protein [Tanacetum cinerariifolium]